jgi:flagellar hook assembly protein FlgD
VRSIVRFAFAGFIGIAGLVTSLVTPLPNTLAAAAPKVVIIVGPVGSKTASYRAEGDAAAAAAAKYTTNVIKLYTPNATWAVVKPALQGASIVIYFGHGNGFPSPYSTTLKRDRQNGLGLNPAAVGDDTATKYWGEQYLASDVRLASNAVVLLGHLCYASGSSEPGKPAPTVDVAKQRVDNFAAGFIAAGAAGVFADAHGKAVAEYVDALFSTHQTLGQVWATAPKAQGNAFSFPSKRTPGMTAHMDPDSSSGEFHRSFVGNPDLQTDAVIAGAGTTGGTTGGTVSTPATPTPAPAPTPSPASGTTEPEVVSTGPPPTAVDTVAPTLAATGSTAFAPTTPADGSGNVDRWVGTFKVSEPGTIDATIVTIGGATSVTWDWRGEDGVAAQDGQYLVTLAVRDDAGNSSPQTAVLVSVFRALTKVVASTALFYPQDRDAYAPSTRLSFQLAVPATVSWTISDTAGRVVYTRYQNTPMAARSVAWIWTGLDQVGNAVAPGRYFATITATNGTLGTSATTALTVAAFAVTTSPTTAVRGRNLTVTASSAEPLSGSPRLTIRQPGAATRTVLMTRIGTNTWRATIRLASGGGTGKVTLEVSGRDVRGGSNLATAGLTLK